MNREEQLKILLAPHVSEKTSQSTGVYVFEVCKTATKPRIKNAVEELFKTKVDCVRIVNVKTKPKRFGNKLGRSKAWKKAYVTLQAGQEINFAGAQ